MRTKMNFTWRVVVACLLVATLLSPVNALSSLSVAAMQGVGAAAGQQSAPQNVISVTLDGVRDAGYVKIATDPIDLDSDLGWLAVAWMELTNLYVAADATNLYVYADLPNYTLAGSCGQIGLAMDVDAKPQSGGTSDPWGNAITYAYQYVDGAATSRPVMPDYLIRGNIKSSSGDCNGQDNGWTELRTWNSGNWGTGGGTNWGGITSGQVGTHVAYSDNQGIEFAIPLADIGNPDPAAVHFQFLAMQGGGTKGAFDTLPSDDQTTGLDDATTQTQLVSVPLALDAAGDLPAPGPAEWNGVAWTDMTRMHIWADHNSLHLYIPAAYTSTISSGQIGVAIDTKSGGGSSDPWANGITYAYTTIDQNLGHAPITPGGTFLPDYMIRGNVLQPSPSDNGWTELRTWNGSDFNTGGGTNWGGIGGSGDPKVAWADGGRYAGGGVRLTIPFEDIGVVAEDVIHLQFFGTQGGGDKGAYDTVPADDQSTGWADATTQLVLATYTIPNIPRPSASQDNNVWWDGLGHHSQDLLYRVPFGAVNPGDEVILRFRSFHNDLTRVRIRFWDTAESREYYKDMAIVASDVDCYDPYLTGMTCDFWELKFTPTALASLYYRFIAIDGTATAYYADDGFKDGGEGEITSNEVDNSYVITVYDEDFETEAWMKNAIIYQVFPDRFRNGNLGNDPAITEPRYGYPSGSTAAQDKIMLKDWTDMPEGYCRGYTSPTVACEEQPRGRDYYGGDLRGLIDKLDYMDALGVNVIYLNPIFEAGSNHLYDTQDYLKIDHFFGNNEDFKELATKAHARGMKIILDGVFNHVSSDSPYMDRYGHYDTVGACESLDSPYRNWFTFTDVAPGTGVCAGTDGAKSANYDGWFGYDSLPVLNKNNQEVVDLIYNTNEAAARYWLTLGADGWRLDVMPDASFPEGFWQNFRDTVLAVKPDAIILGELWKKGDVLPYVYGDTADSTMNYRFRNAILGFFGTVDNKGFYDDGQTNQPPSLFVRKMLSVREDYPDAAYYTLMNLLGSHDTRRILWTLAPGLNNREEKEFNAANLAFAKQMLQLSAVIQMTTPGAPTIYYGDEVGVTGDDDPDDRRTFPWIDVSRLHIYMPAVFRPGATMASITPALQQVQGAGYSASGADYYNAGGDHTLLDWYRTLTALRKERAVFRDGELTFLLANDVDRTLGYLMHTSTDAALVVVNRDSITHTIEIDGNGYLPKDVELYDALGGIDDVMASSAMLSFELPAYSAAVLLPYAGQDLVAPKAPADLKAVAGNGVVTLSWTGLASKFHVYRSPVTGGGYAYIGTVGGAGYAHNYSDTTVKNGRYYYYVVRPEDWAGNLGKVSNEANAIPAFPITDAKLQWPPTIYHTIGITPTTNIYGQVLVPGLTDSGGPSSGIKAQLGYGVISTTPADWTTWKNMTFNTTSGNYFEYQANLRPEQIGAYNYLVRFSTNLGLSWNYGFYSGARGVMTVTLSTDTISPVAPANLQVTDWSAGFITLAWQAVPDAAEYWLYRSTTAGSYDEPLIKVTAPITTYKDLEVNPDTTYFYKVKALDASLNRSLDSNEVSKKTEPKMVNVTFRVLVPDETIGTVYIAGGAPMSPEWNPGAIPMTNKGGGIWEITLTFPDGTALQYKYTRGSWERVEWWGSIVSVANRHASISYGTTGKQLIEDTATDWGSGSDDHKAVQYWRDPLVKTTAPANNSSGAAPAKVVVNFVREIQPLADPNNFSRAISVTLGTAVISGTITPSAGVTTTLTWTPSAPLAAGTYTVTVFNLRSSLAGESVSMQVAYVFKFTVTP